ncbi:MAG: hypothetical protein H6Q72_4844, partial [Firmicutes bacterium]|nr:hypothetical protein [Bacillota bacterium]
MNGFPGLFNHRILAAKLSGELPTYFNTEEMA